MTAPIELGQPVNITVELCPVFVRGEAYLALGDGHAAAAEFQKFIDHRGVVVNFPWGALARLGAARAYAMHSDTAKAKIAYQEFLALWKDADPQAADLSASQSRVRQAAVETVEKRKSALNGLPRLSPIATAN